MNHIILLGIGDEAWLICDNEDASKIFVAIENLVFGFELFIGGRAQTTRADNSWATKGKSTEHACKQGYRTRSTSVIIEQQWLVMILQTMSIGFVSHIWKICAGKGESRCETKLLDATFSNRSALEPPR